MGARSSLDLTSDPRILHLANGVIQAVDGVQEAEATALHNILLARVRETTVQILSAILVAARVALGLCVGRDKTINRKKFSRKWD